MEVRSGAVFVGEHAQEMVEDDPAGVVETLKRRLQDQHVRANRRKVTPQALLAELFTVLRSRVGEEVAAFGRTTPRRVHLTVRALYGAAIKRLLEEGSTPQTQ